VLGFLGSGFTWWFRCFKQAVAAAAGSLRDLRIAEVVEMDVTLGAKGDIETYRTKLKVSFKYEQP